MDYIIFAIIVGLFSMMIFSDEYETKELTEWFILGTVFAPIFACIISYTVLKMIVREICYLN